jgi:hypothetical protein
MQTTSARPAPMSCANAVKFSRAMLNGAMPDCRLWPVASRI